MIFPVCSEVLASCQYYLGNWYLIFSFAPEQLYIVGESFLFNISPDELYLVVESFLLF
jgi:hypothetical protein